ncbi:MAG: hypothetical protein CMP53_05525 [Flavobacteriales bacterium]|nr:hypothetical protein [Flavobacteriales bacterium]|tara:strand:- start:1436 stop:1831 length:396 start_codon:yes stop_codon:yes gene_type:complete
MQTVASKLVVIDGPEDEVKEYISATVIMHDFGMAVKNDAGLTLYTWDRVKQVSWSDPQVINQVWGLMLAQLASDLEFDDEYLWDDEDEEDPYGVSEEEPAKEESKETPEPAKEEEVKEESEKPKSNDDPYA